jgi:type III secretory pathway component EscV
MSSITTIDLQLDTKLLLGRTPWSLEEIRGATQAYVERMLSDLAIPSQVKLSLEMAPAPAGFRVLINDVAARLRRLPKPETPTTNSELVEQICTAIFENRELLITSGVVAEIRASKNGYQHLSREHFTQYLRLLVRYCFRADRQTDAADASADLETAWAPEDCFESAIASLDNLQVILHFSQDAPPMALGDQMPPVQDSLFQEFGVRVPNIVLKDNPLLKDSEWRLQIHDLTLPTFESLEEDVVWKITGLLRRNVASFIAHRVTEFELGMLQVSNTEYLALLRTGVTTLRITRVARELVREGLSIASLRPLLHGLLDARSSITLNPGTDLVFLPHAVSARMMGPNSYGYDNAIWVECVRRHYRKLLILNYLSGSPAGAFALDSKIAERAEEAAQRPLADAEAAQIVDAITHAVETATAGPRYVILTSAAARGTIRRLIEIELPDVAVLSYQELGPAAAPLPLLGTIALAEAGA